MIYDSDGNFVNQFGKLGFDPGQFDEPVGFALAVDGRIFIADTWNQRTQVMVPDSSGNYSPLINWEIAGWYGTSLDNKPFVAIDEAAQVFISDPEGSRVLEFTENGQFLRYWGVFGSGLEGMNIPTGLAVDPKSGIWVADSGNNRILHFTLP